MKFIKPEAYADPKIVEAATNISRFKLKYGENTSNLPVWYDGVSDLIVNHRVSFHVEPSGRVRFVVPDHDKFTMPELVKHFGRGVEVVVISVRKKRRLVPEARIVHCGKPSMKEKVNELATAMLVLNFRAYFENPVLIHGAALFCHESHIILH